MRLGVARALADSSDFRLLVEQSSQKWEIPLMPWTPMNRREKFVAASFIVGGDIRNKYTKNTRTVTDISTPCLSACVDNEH